MPFSSGSFSLYTPGNPVVTGTTIASTWANNTLNDIATGLSTAVLKDGSQTITADLPMSAHKLTGLSAGSASGHSVRWEQSAPGVVTAKGDAVIASGSGAVTNLAVGANGQSLVADSNQTNGLKYGYPAIRDYIAGCTLSTAGSSSTMSIAAGSATDSTNVDMMVLAAIAKTTSAWAVGTNQGGLDTGTIATGTWYYFYVIKRVDTGVVDVLFSTSSSAPTMPANYTLKRYIGAGKTDGSSKWTLFYQNYDTFTLDIPISEFSGTWPNASLTQLTVTAIPPGVAVEGIFHIGYGTGVSGAVGLYNNNKTTIGTAAVDADVSYRQVSGTAGGRVTGRCWTSSAGVIKYTGDAAGITGGEIWSVGWVDPRGKNA